MAISKRTWREDYSVEGDDFTALFGNDVLAKGADLTVQAEAHLSTRPEFATAVAGILRS